MRRGGPNERERSVGGFAGDVFAYVGRTGVLTDFDMLKSAAPLSCCERADDEKRFGDACLCALVGVASRQRQRYTCEADVMRLPTVEQRLVPGSER